MSVNFRLKPFKFYICFRGIQMEGIVSQNPDLEPSFHFMKCRSLHSLKVARFLNIFL